MSLVWLLAAGVTSAFAPRGVALNSQDLLTIPAVSAAAGLLVALPAAAICLGLWWLLRHAFYGPLAVAAGALLVLALLLPHDLTVFFLPPPLGLLISSWLLTHGRGWPPRRG